MWGGAMFPDPPSLRGKSKFRQPVKPGGSAKEDPHACGGRGGGWGGVGGAGSSRMWDHVGVELS